MSHSWKISHSKITPTPLKENEENLDKCVISVTSHCMMILNVCKYAIAQTN